MEVVENRKVSRLEGGAKSIGGKSVASKKKKKRVSSNVKAGIIFPIGRVKRILKEGRYAKRVSFGAAVFMAGILEYLTSEIVEIAGHISSGLKRTRITPRHLQLAVRSDQEIDKVFGKAVIAEGGVLPFVHPFLLPRGNQKEKRSKTNYSQDYSNQEEISQPESTMLDTKFAEIFAQGSPDQEEVTLYQ